jgi:hypothetical protein
LGRSHFWWWKKRLCSPLTKFVEVKLTPTVLEGRAAGPASRAEVLARHAADLALAGEGRVEVVLRNGRSLWVGRGFDAGHVRALAAVLESEA